MENMFRLCVLLAERQHCGITHRPQTTAPTAVQRWMVMGMAELIDKWEVVNKLIRLENQYNFYKEKWNADVLYRRICELEIGIGKTEGLEVVLW